MGMVMQWDTADSVTAERLMAMDEDTFLDWLDDPSSRTVFDVDKAWHAVHFTLTGSVWDVDGPMGTVVLGGEPFGEDVGYGPPRWLSPDRVAVAARELAALTPQEFAARLNFGSMATQEIYPSIWDGDPGAGGLVDFVVAGYESIRRGFAEAAAANQGFVISLL